MTTTESFFHGRLTIRQKKKGFRFSIDSAILAHHVHLKKCATAVDLGTGCGVIALILAARFPDAFVYGIEIQEDLARLAMENVGRNRLVGRVAIVCGDIKQCPFRPGWAQADLVVCNPPYCMSGAGRVSPDREKALATHEISGTLTDMVACGAGLLRPSGRFVVVYPAARLAELITQMRAFGLEVKRVRPVYPKKGLAAARVLAEGVKHARPGVVIQPPLVVHKPDGGYTPEMEKMLRGS